MSCSGKSSAPSTPGPRRSAEAVSGSVPGARPMPRSIRPGWSASSIPNCSATARAAWLGSITPPEPSADGRRDRGEVREQHRRRRAGDPRHVVVLGDPVPPVAEALDLLHQLDGVAQRVGGRGAAPDGREVEDGEGEGVVIGRFSHPRLQPPRSGIRSRRRPDDRSTGVRSGCRSPARRCRRCSSSRRRRVASDWARSVSGSANQWGSAHCTGWCARSPVISAWSPPDSRCTATCPGVWPGVSSRRISSVTRWSGGDEIGEPGVDHRSHRVVERHRVARVAARGRPVRPFVATEQVAGVRERRDPLPVDQHRVPPHVVEVQVGADHGVDLFTREAWRRRGRSRNGVCRLSASMPGMRRSFPMQVSMMMLPVAHGDAEGVDRQHEVAVVVDEVRVGATTNATRSPRRSRRAAARRAGCAPRSRPPG